MKSNYFLARAYGTLLTTVLSPKQSPITPSPTPALQKHSPSTFIPITIRLYTDRLVIADWVISYWLGALRFSFNVHAHAMPLHAVRTRPTASFYYSSVWPHMRLRGENVKWSQILSKTTKHILFDSTLLRHCGAAPDDLRSNTQQSWYWNRGMKLIPQSLILFEKLTVS